MLILGVCFLGIGCSTEGSDGEGDLGAASAPGDTGEFQDTASSSKPRYVAQNDFADEVGFIPWLVSMAVVDLAALDDFGGPSIIFWNVINSPIIWMVGLISIRIMPTIMI